MRKLILSMWVTADGYVVEDGSDAQSFMFAMDDDEEQDRFGDERFDDVAEFALGAATYRAWSGFWPTADGPMAAVLNRQPKVVFTRSGDVDASWGPVRVLRGEAAETVADLKAEDGGDIVLQGSIELTHSLLDAGALDELRLLVVPVAVGAGKPLFEDLGHLQPLQLVSTRTFSSGLQAQVWQPAD